MDRPKEGDVVLLNDLARDWIRGQEVFVDEVVAWGIKYHTTDAQGGVYHYRATWDQLKGDYS